MVGQARVVQEPPNSGDPFQGDFGEAWLVAVALGCGLKAGRDPGPDREKADIELTLLEEIAGTYHPRIKAQVKTKVGLAPDGNGTFSYNLDVETYNVLVRTNHSTRRVLVVIGLAKEGERVKLDGDGTVLRGRGAWLSLEGCQPSNNNSSQIVRLPVANTLDPAGLRRMLVEFGVNSSTPVPSVDPWSMRSGQGEVAGSD
jgi:hypothetical protein